MTIFGFDIYERHLQRLLLFGLTAWFIRLNWGSSIDAVKHIVFCIRTFNQDELSPEVRDQIALTLIPFGQTVTLLICCLSIWKFLDWTFLLINPDWKEQDRRIAIMRNENEALRDSLSQNNKLLTSLAGNLDAVLETNIALEKHKDRIVELGFEFEKIGLNRLKKRRHPPRVPHKLNGQDLFKQPKNTKRKPPPRPNKPVFPKF